MDIGYAYNQMLKRKYSDDDFLSNNFYEDYQTLNGKTTQYLIGAMQEVQPKYTEKLLDTANRIENQISKEMYLSYRIQGSVSTNTHIRHHSDVDLLVITREFSTLESPMKPTIYYEGNPIETLLKVRRDVVGILDSKFPVAEVDDTGAMSISISGGSLPCKVDVVPSNWFNTKDYKVSGLEKDRGIQVCDKKKLERKLNFPFLFKHRLDLFDTTHYGIPKKQVRLLKTLKADFLEESCLSSYDLSSIVYRSPVNNALHLINQPIDILQNLKDWLLVLSTNSELVMSLKVIDDTRLIFDSEEKKKEISDIWYKLKLLLDAVLTENPYGLKPILAR